MFQANVNASLTARNLEVSIISANKKYFGIDVESKETNLEPSLLYQTLIEYFKIDTAKHDN